MLRDDDRSILSVHDGAYQENRRLEIRTAPDGLYYVTITKMPYPDLNHETRCRPESMKGILTGLPLEIPDSKGFVLRFQLEGENVHLEYIGDVERDPNHHFRGDFYASDLKALFDALPY